MQGSSSSNKSTGLDISQAGALIAARAKEAIEDKKDRGIDGFASTSLNATKTLEQSKKKATNDLPAPSVASVENSPKALSARSSDKPSGDARRLRNKNTQERIEGVTKSASLAQATPKNADRADSSVGADDGGGSLGEDVKALGKTLATGAAEIGIQLATSGGSTAGRAAKTAGTKVGSNMVRSQTTKAAAKTAAEKAAKSDAAQKLASNVISAINTKRNRVSPEKGARDFRGRGEKLVDKIADKTGIDLIDDNPEAISRNLAKLGAITDRLSNRLKLRLMQRTKTASIVALVAILVMANFLSLNSQQQQKQGDTARAAGDICYKEGSGSVVGVGNYVNVNVNDDPAKYLDLANVPAHAVPWIMTAAANSEEGIPPAFFAALMDIETDFRPALFAPDKNGGTWGLFQINRYEWRINYGEWSDDRNNNGVWDIKDPLIHAAVGAKYLDKRLRTVRKIRETDPEAAIPTELQALAVAHNAGEGRLKTYPRIPKITRKYIVQLNQHMKDYSAKGRGSVGVTEVDPNKNNTPSPTESALIRASADGTELSAAGVSSSASTFSLPQKRNGDEILAFAKSRGMNVTDASTLLAVAIARTGMRITYKGAPGADFYTNPTMSIPKYRTDVSISAIGNASTFPAGVYLLKSSEGSFLERLTIDTSSDIVARKISQLPPSSGSVASRAAAVSSGLSDLNAGFAAIRASAFISAFGEKYGYATKRQSSDSDDPFSKGKGPLKEGDNSKSGGIDGKADKDTWTQQVLGNGGGVSSADCIDGQISGGLESMWVSPFQEFTEVSKFSQQQKFVVVQIKNGAQVFAMTSGFATWSVKPPAAEPTILTVTHQNGSVAVYEFTEGNHKPVVPLEGGMVSAGSVLASAEGGPLKVSLSLKVGSSTVDPIAFVKQQQDATGGELALGFANGTIPKSALCAVVNAPGHYLQCPAAKALDRLIPAFEADLGQRFGITDSYRPLAVQCVLKRQKPRLAARPGTSNHGWGFATDLAGGINSFGTRQHRWMQANAGRYGWQHPPWAQRGGSKPEAWHWEHVSSVKKPKISGVVGFPLCARFGY